MEGFLTYLAQQAVETSFWAQPRAADVPIWRQNFFWLIIFSIILASALFFALSRVPSNWRRPIAVSVAFLAGFFYVAEWLMPRFRATGESVAFRFLFWEKEVKTEPGEAVSQFFVWKFDDAVVTMSNLGQILAAMLLSLGIVSIFRVHVGRIRRMDRDWFYSVVLLLAFFVMVIYGWSNWRVEQDVANKVLTKEEAQAEFSVKAFDFLFDGLLVNLDAAMFSLIAFFILSAAYRAFRVRNVEAGIMMGAAVIILMSFVPLGLALTSWLDPNTFAGNFRIDSIADWLLDTINTPALRAIDLGLGLGILAMAIRIMLGLERGVSVD